MLLFMIGFMVLFGLSIVLFTIAGNDVEYKQIVLNQQSYESRDIAFERGEILDRNGTVLAGNERVYNLILDPKIILSDDGKYTETTLTALTECYGYERSELQKILDEEPGSSYVRFEKQMSEERKGLFDTYEEEFNKNQTKTGGKQKIVGVWFEEEYRRIYPYDNLASQVIGFTSSDGKDGRMGLEAYYNDVLNGVNGREYGYFDDDSTRQREIEPAQNGYTLVSTLDLYVQQVCQKYVDEYVQNVGCKDVGVIVMNPQNAEILAMAMKNSYNLNDPADLSGYCTPEELAALEGEGEEKEEERTLKMNEMWKNHCISDTFEPGSTAKTFTIGAALEEGKITGNESYFCGGSLWVGGHEIHCHNEQGHGALTVTQTLMSSCNVGLMYIAKATGAEAFSKYQEIFGFGQLTGIDLPNEASAAGLLYTAENMDSASLATNSFGQNYNVTMIQIAAAYASVLNGGNYYEPRLVRQIIDENGAVIENTSKVLVRKTLSTSTCEFLKNALFQTVEGGTGRKAAIPGYRMGGKTGTAEKLPREADTFVVSFVADIPADYPEVFIYVAIDEPQVEKQSDSSQATEMCRNILKEILPYLNIYPTEDIPEEETEAPEENPENQENPGDGENPEGEEDGEEQAPNPITIIDDNEEYSNGGFSGQKPRHDDEEPGEGENQEGDGQNSGQQGGQSGEQSGQNPEEGRQNPSWDDIPANSPSGNPVTGNQTLGGRPSGDENTPESGADTGSDTEPGQNPSGGQEPSGGQTPDT